MRVLMILMLVVTGCGSTRSPTTDAPIVFDAPPAGCDGRCAEVGEVCGTSNADQDAGALPCRPGLVCCYPCGIPDCLDRCTEPCGPVGPGCQEGGCPGPFP